MTLKEAVLITRRHMDWLKGHDMRRLSETGLTEEIRYEAVEVILASHGLSKPLTECRNCGKFSLDSGCAAGMIGRCTAFVPREGDKT